MQIVSIEHNFHEMSKSVFWEKYEKIFQYVISCIFYPACKVLNIPHMQKLPAY